MNHAELIVLVHRLYTTEQISFTDARALLVAVEVAATRWTDADTRKHGEIVHGAVLQMKEEG